MQKGVNMLSKIRIVVISLLLFLELGISSCQRKNHEEFKYYETGEVKERLVFEPQKPISDSNYTLYDYDKEGVMFSKTIFTGGIISDFVEYYNNGKIKRTQPYKAGNRYGIERKYTLNDEIAETNLYINGYLLIKMKSYNNKSGDVNFYYYVEPDTIIEIGRILYDEKKSIIDDQSFYFTIDGKDSLNFKEEQKLLINTYTFGTKSKISKAYFCEFDENYKFIDSSSVVELESENNMLSYSFFPKDIGYNLFTGKIYVMSEVEINGKKEEMTREFIVYKDFYVKNREE
jgi:hypothetical protein